MEFSTQAILILFSTGVGGGILSNFLSTQQWYQEFDSTQKFTTATILAGTLGLFSTALLTFIPQDTFLALDSVIKPYLPTISILAPVVLTFISSQATYAINKFLKKKNTPEPIPTPIPEPVPTPEPIPDSEEVS